MPAAYDTYDYPLYWEKREYEHKAEVHALQSFLQKTSDNKTILAIGGGYGRLVPFYKNYTKNIILTDPSSKLLKIARENLGKDTITYIQTTAENLPKKVKKSSVDVVLCIRVAHHIKDLDNLFEIVHKTLKDDGYFIFEFANKRHLKALIKNFLQGDFTFGIDIFPKDIRSKKFKKQKTLPFVNYHPHIIQKKLISSGFTIIEKRSVSNIRSVTAKRYLPLSLLLFLEKFLQKLFAPAGLGPSIFIMARKTDG